MKLSKYFVDNFLTVNPRGGDNCVFTNCPEEVLSIAEDRLLSNQKSGCAHVISISDAICDAYEEAVEGYDPMFFPKIVARNLVNGLVMKSLLESKKSALSKSEREMLDAVNQGLEDILSCDYDGMVEYAKNAPTHFDISSFIEDNGRHEIAFVLRDAKSKRIQQAINNFLSARSRYVIKVFSDAELASCLDEGGILFNVHMIIRASRSVISLKTNHKECLIPKCSY